MRLILPELRGSGKRNRNIALLGPWLIFFTLCGAIAAVFSAVTTHGVGVSTGFTDGLFYCDTSGEIRYAYASNAFARTSPYWDSELFLSVTMGFHGLTFTQAKAIDICFDLIVGRGSQVLLALATYPILRRAFLRSMEVREFSLAFVVPFFMERLSGYTLWAMVTNTRTVRKKDPEPGQQIARSRIRIDWRVVLIFLVGCYVLAVPTFLSAMTSYQARGQPFFPVDNGSSYLSVENIVIPDFLVEGGEQIGLSRRYPLYNTSDPQLYATLLEYDEVRKTQVAKIWDDDWGLYRSTYSIAYSNAPEYLSKYSNLGNLETKKVLESEAAFKKTRDQLPLRQNITDTRTPPMWSFTLWPRNATWGETSYFTPRERCMNSTIVVRNTTYDLDAPLYLGSNHDSQGNIDINTLFALDTHSAPRVGSDLAERGICLPSKEYVWGFSSLMLFTFCMLSVAVLLLLIILHYDAYFNSMADRYKLQISPYRDVLNLAEELRAHYGEAEVVSMPARELDKAMQKDPATIGLETTTLHKTRAARWKQSSEKPRMPTWKRLRRKPEAADSTRSDAEASLMSVGLDAHGPDFEMGKLPTKAVTKPSD